VHDGNTGVNHRNEKSNIANGDEEDFFFLQEPFIKNCTKTQEKESKCHYSAFGVFSFPL